MLMYFRRCANLAVAVAGTVAVAVAVAKLLLQVLLVAVTSGSLRTAVYFQSIIGGGCWFATAEEY